MSHRQKDKILIIINVIIPFLIVGVVFMAEKEQAASLRERKENNYGGWSRGTMPARRSINNFHCASFVKVFSFLLVRER